MVSSSEWNATHDHMPPEPKKLIVHGSVDLPSPEHTAELRPAKPQGSNDLDYVLDVIVHEPDGPFTPIVTPFEIDYLEPTDVEYKTVSIRPDGPEEIEVIHTH